MHPRVHGASTNATKSETAMRFHVNFILTCTKLVRSARRRALWTILPLSAIWFTGCTSIVLKAQDSSTIHIGGSVSNEATKGHSIPVTASGVPLP